MRCFFRYFLLVSACIFLTGVSAWAQQYHFKNYSVNEGLAQSQVYAFAQDAQQHLWIGSRGGGADRFDGHTFQHFTEDNGLAGNFLRCMVSDKAGRIWFGTDNGLSMYNGVNFRTFDTSGGVANAPINALCFDSRNQLWIATEKGVFVMSDTISGTVRLMSASVRATALQTGKEGSVWAGTSRGLLQFIPQGTSYLQKAFAKENGIPHEDITALTGDEKGIWAATYGGGIFHFDGERFFSVQKARGLPHNSVYCLFYAGNSELWTGSSAGVTVLKYAGYSHDSLQMTHFTQANGLCNNVIRSLFKDHFGNMWAGSSGGGMSRLDSRRFRQLKPVKELLGDLVFSVASDPKGTLWLATSAGGVTLFDGHSLRRISGKEGFTSGKVKCLYKMPDGTLWLGTTGSGAYFYDGKTFRQFTRKDGLSSLFINAITSDRKGRVWFATAGGSACYYDPETHRFSKIKASAIGSDRIHTVYADAEGTIWLGTLQAGLVKISEFEKGSIPVVTRLSASSAGSGTANVRCLIRTPVGQLLMGTAGAGIWMLRGQKFIRIGQQELASGNVYFLHADAQQRLWAGTDRGIVRFTLGPDGTLLHFQQYTAASGLTSNESTHNGVFEEPGGRLWFGTIAGATCYDPTMDVAAGTAPLVVLTGIRLFFNEVQNTSFAGKLQPWYPVPKSLSLPYDQNSISLQFTGVDLREPEGLTYSWELQGSGQGPSPFSTKTEAVFTNLQPGRYAFQVQVKNAAGKVAGLPEPFVIYIGTPIWATLWFRIILGALILGLLYGLYAWRIRYLKMQNRRETEQLETARKMLELELKALHLQMNPHFLFNCLNSIKGLIAEHKTQEANLYLTRFAKLMRTVLESSRKSHVSLAGEMELIRQYVQLEQLSRDTYLQLETDLETNLQPDHLFIPSMLLQPFVENAILHGLSSRKEGLIRFIIRKEAAYLQVIIQDNGVGRTAVQPQLLPEEHAGIAVEVIMERLRMLGIQENAVTYTDLVESNIPVGTRVEIHLPYQEER